ncbi:hypothetical protein EK0264_03780 [Epidermidibacterium keratini]|uniref:Uncharacterized protein n=1 Tax=Epidermidibacterium keratini TaxID=1891644 RepID=A0A7L4YJN6_9ACTN|nr:hypothetical protein [Epidermidibacterium keratini]QHB99490.1 hypothetical protein EK0264_03780 [Epidermidibacterium keratini]
MATYQTDTDIVMREVTGIDASESLTVDMLDGLDLGGGALMWPGTQHVEITVGAPASVYLPAGTPARYVAEIDGQRSRVFTVPAGDDPIGIDELLAAGQ